MNPFMYLAGVTSNAGLYTLVWRGAICTSLIWPLSSLPAVALAQEGVIFPLTWVTSSGDLNSMGMSPPEADPPLAEKVDIGAAT